MVVIDAPSVTALDCVGGAAAAGSGRVGTAATTRVVTSMTCAVEKTVTGTIPAYWGTPSTSALGTAFSVSKRKSTELAS